MDNKISVRLAHNDAIFKDDRIGFYHEYTPTREWLTTEKEDTLYRMVEDENLTLRGGDYKLFKLRYLISMSHKQFHTERYNYAFLHLLGDFGGFQQSLSIIFGSIMYYYSRFMYNSGISTEVDVAM